MLEQWLTTHCGMGFNPHLTLASVSQMIGYKLNLLTPDMLSVLYHISMFVMLLRMFSNVHCVPCLLCSTEVLFYVAGSGRERSDSVPSRTRTISDGSHPLAHPHSSRSLVPNSGSSRPHSVCWPAGSPVRWVPVNWAHAVCIWVLWPVMHRHCVFAVLHQVRARRTHRARLYPSTRVTGMDGEATDIPWPQISLWFWRRVSAMTCGPETRHFCCLCASSLQASCRLIFLQVSLVR